MITVVILDDHPLVLKGVEAMLSKVKVIHIEDTFNNGDLLLQYLLTHTPDIILMDINMPGINGLDLCKLVVSKHPQIRVIGLSNYSDTSFVKSMMRNGAKGYLPKNTTKDELVDAITTVYGGDIFINKDIQKRLIHESIGSKPVGAFIPKLTRREKETLDCIAAELTNAEIAEKLFVSIKTIECHRNNLLQKFGVRNTAGLIRAAMTKGLL